MKPYEKYKDSGVDWIGKVPEHWEVKRGDSVFVLSKNIAKQAELNGQQVFHYSIPVIQETGTGAIEDGNTVDSDKFILEGDEILFSKLNPRKGTVVISQKHELMTIASTEFVILKPKKDDINFLFYLLKSNGFQDSVCSVVQSATRSHQRANPVDIYKNKILLPPLPEQTAIARYLDQKTTEIDQLIAQKERLLALWEEEKTALINQAVTRGLDAGAKMKDSGVAWLGEVPEHWEVKRLKYVLKEKLQYGANEPSEFENPEDPRYIRITDFDDSGSLRNDTFKSLPLEKAKEYLLNEGDILFARSGATVGKTFQFKNYVGTACYAGYLIRAVVNQKIMLPDFLYFFTKSGAYSQWKDSIFNQATIQNIGADKYAYLEIPTPPLPEQTAIVRHIETQTARIQTQMDQTRKLIELLKEYRATLISEVVTGKIKITA